MKVTTLVSLLVAATVVIVALVGINHGWFVPSPPAEAGEPVVLLSADDVTELTIEAEGKPAIRLILHGGQWRMRAPLRGLADPRRVRRAIESVLDMRISRLYGPSDLKRPTVKAAGLDAPRVTVTLTDRSGARHTVRIGGNPRFIPQTYTQVRGGSDILLAGPDPTAKLTRPLHEIRRPTLIEFDPSRLQRLIVTAPDSYTLTRVADTWRISAGGVRDALADGQQVEALIARLHQLQIAEITPAPAVELKAFGLDPPAATFMLKLAPLPGPREAVSDPGDPTGPNAIHMALGTRDGLVYAMLEGNPWLMTIAPDDFTALLPDTESLRDRRILAAPADRIVRIAVHRGDATVTLERRGAQWMKADGAPVDAAHVDALLADLTEPRVTDFVTSYSSLAGFGLTEPRMRFTCTDRDGAARTILIGDADSRQRVYVKHDDDHTVMMAHAPELAAVGSEP